MSRLSALLLLLAMVCGISTIAATMGMAQTIPPGRFLPGQGSSASTATPLPSDLKPEEVDGAVAKLTDSQTRDLLLKKLKSDVSAREGAEAAASGTGIAEVLMQLRDVSARLSERVEVMAASTAEIGVGVDSVINNLTDLEGVAKLPRAFWIILAVLSIAGVAEAIIGRLLMFTMLRRQREDVFARITQLTLKVALIFLFAFTAYFSSFLFLERFDPMRELVIAMALWVVSVRLLVVIAAQFLGRVHASGILPLPSRMRHAAFWAIVLLGGGFSFAAIAVGLLQLLGLPEELLQLFILTSGTVGILGLLIALGILGRAKRQAFDADNRGAGTTLGNFLVIAYSLMAWGVWSINIVLQQPNQARAALLSSMVILAVPIIDIVARLALTKLTQVRSGQWSNNLEEVIEQMPFSKAAQGILGVLRAIAILSAFALLGEAVGFGIINMIDTSSGRAVLRAIFNVSLTVLIGLTIWEVVTTLIGRKLAAERRDEGPSEAARAEAEGGVAVAATRTETLLPLLRSFMFIALIAFVTMIVLSSIGVDIGPLLAGAGVVGIAVGFGAQTLVRDIVSGIFFLIDDAFRLGEYIEMGVIRGEVEKISIRSLRIRHHRGAIHTIPFSELRYITNYNRDWVIYKFTVNLVFETDVDKVKKIIKGIGQEMMDHPEYGRLMLEPLKSQGVTAFGAHALTLRVKFKCKPREQFVLRRFAHQRIRDELFKSGIKFAYPTVTVQVAEGDGDQEGADPAGGGEAGGTLAKPLDIKQIGAAAAQSLGPNMDGTPGAVPPKPA